MTPRRTSARPDRRPGGQATVELAIGFPIILIGVLVVLQLALVGRDQLLVSHASREAARAAAVDPRAGAGREGALAATTGLDPDRLRVDTDHVRERVRVHVQYRSRTVLPIVGAIIPDPVLHATVTMLDEEK